MFIFDLNSTAPLSIIYHSMKERGNFIHNSEIDFGSAYSIRFSTESVALTLVYVGSIKCTINKMYDN